MSTGTGIEWTQATWNPVVGCTRASAGCDFCYAVKMTHRLAAMGQSKYAGLTVLNNRGERHFNGVVRTDPGALGIPFGWRKPRRVFVNSMSDLFHRDVPFDFIERVFSVMEQSPQHDFQVLTKRPERAAEFYAVMASKQERDADDSLCVPLVCWPSSKVYYRRWPLPNVWLGTSVEDQDAADKRIPHLLRCPAAVRFLSIEPLLGPVDIERHLWAVGASTAGPWRYPSGRVEPARGIGGSSICRKPARELHWVIVGCESKPGKALGRFADGYAEAAMSIIRQCREAGVPVFHKQMPVKGRACGDAAQFPERWQVREFPQETRA